MRRMFEKPRCKCPRCIARRRSRYLVISGVCTAIAVGYFAVAEYQQAVPDLSLEGDKGPADEPSSDRASIPRGNSGSVLTEIGQSGAEEKQQVTVIAENHREPSTVDDAAQNVYNPIENRPISDGDLQLANHPSSNPHTDSPASETSPEPTDSELSARELAATSPGRKSRDGLQLRPVWSFAAAAHGKWF
jgi:hypothetical protein